MIAVAVVAAVVIIGLVCVNNRKSQPVWNDVQIDDSVHFGIGMDWEEGIQNLQDAGLEINRYTYTESPSKNGESTGLSFFQSFDEKSVRSIYYVIGENETDCVIYLAGLRIDQQISYADLAEAFGEADKKSELKDGGAYYSWIDREKGLVIEVDANEKLLNFDLLPYEE